MLIECPECKQPVSDQAPTCPHCGVAVTPGGKAVKVGSRRKATQFVWFFFWLMIGGFAWAIFREPDVSLVPGKWMVAIGMFGWFGSLVYRWLNT